MPLTDERLADITARLMTTPGTPWRMETTYLGGKETEDCTCHDVRNVNGKTLFYNPNLLTEAEAVFIADAPNAIGELLAEVRRLRKIEAAVQEFVQALDQPLDAYVQALMPSSAKTGAQLKTDWGGR